MKTWLYVTDHKGSSVMVEVPAGNCLTQALNMLGVCKDGVTFRLDLETPGEALVVWSYSMPMVQS